MEARKLLPALALAVVLSMAALIWYFPLNGDFRSGNPFWNGLSTFTTQFKVSPIDSFSSLPSNPNGTAFVVVPYEPFTQSELENLRNYASQGGTLVVLDDYGYGNRILSHLGLNVRFTGRPLLDPLFDYRNKWLPRIADFASTPTTSNISSIVLNHASSLGDTSDVTVLAYSSRFSFVDMNNDSAWDAGEPMGPLPVAAYARMGEGYVVVIADPSILINSMISMDDNSAFVKNVMELQGSNPQVFVDQTHLPTTPLDGAKNAISMVYAAVSSPLGTLSLIVVISALSLKPIWRKGGKLGEHKESG